MQNLNSLKKKIFIISCQNFHYTNVTYLLTQSHSILVMFVNDKQWYNLSFFLKTSFSALVFSSGLTGIYIYSCRLILALWHRVISQSLVISCFNLFPFHLVYHRYILLSLHLFLYFIFTFLFQFTTYKIRYIKALLCCLILRNLISLI